MMVLWLAFDDDPRRVAVQPPCYLTRVPCKGSRSSRIKEQSANGVIEQHEPFQPAVFI